MTQALKRLKATAAAKSVKLDPKVQKALDAAKAKVQKALDKQYAAIDKQVAQFKKEYGNVDQFNAELAAALGAGGTEHLKDALEEILEEINAFSEETFYEFLGGA